MTERSAEDRKNDAVEEVDALAVAEQKAAANLEMAIRIQADFDNYRKRAQKENEEFKKFAIESFIAEMLDIVDDLERALSHADKGSDLAVGVNAVRNNLIKILRSKGLEEIDTNGKFDPNVHEAFCIQPGEEDGDIVEVFQKGYRIGDRVLRYAKVKVTKTETKEGEQKCQES